MKTIKFISLLIIVSLLNIGAVNAKSPDPTKPKSPYTQLLIDEIRTQVAFPQFAREQGLEGFVLISYDYDELGRLHVIEANSNSAELRDYVIAKLTQIDLCSHARKPGKVYNMRFDFRLI